MNNQDKEFLAWAGGLALLGWLLSRKHGKCPRCNFPVTSKQSQCPNCGQFLNWEGFK